MKVLLSWIREFVDVPESAEEIGKLLSVRGLALEGLEMHGDDVVMDFDVTANRPDCLSMVGIAREIATAYGRPLKVPEGRDFSPAGTRPGPAGTGEGAITITIEAPELLPIHGTKRRGRHPLHQMQRGRLRNVQANRLDRNPRQRHGTPGGVRSGRLQPG